MPLWLHIIIPSNCWLSICGLIHASYEAEIVKKRDQLVRTDMPKTVTAAVLHEPEFRVDALTYIWKH